jgi:hypothetical protein
MARKRCFRFGLPIVFAGRPSVGGVGLGCQPIRLAAAARFGALGGVWPDSVLSDSKSPRRIFRPLGSTLIQALRSRAVSSCWPCLHIVPFAIQLAVKKRWFIRERGVPFHLEIAHPPGACPFGNVAYLGLPFVLLTSSSGSGIQTPSRKMDALIVNPTRQEPRER